MSVFDEFAKVQQTGLPNILVIFGENDDIVQELKSQLLTSVKFDSNDMSQMYFDLSAANANLALEELESLPFFADQKLVILENLSNLTTAKKSVLDDKQLARFASYLDNPADSTQLVLILHGKLDSRLKISKKLKASAVLLEASDLKTPELLRYFAPTGMNSSILNRIFEKSNFTFSVIKQNIDLVKTYAGTRTVTLEDIEKVVPKSLSDNIFQLTDLIFQAKINQARELVADLTLQGEELIKILAVLTNSFQLYYQVKLMQKKSWSESQQTSFLKIHPYRVKLANQAVKRMDSHYLAQSLRELIELDYQIKSSSVDSNYLFDLALIKLALKDSPSHRIK